MGLEPSDALRRAEAEWPRDGKVQILEDDELEILMRDLGSLFTGAQPEHHVNQILAQLERNYLDDLGKGLSPRQGRQQLQRDVGWVMRRLTLLRDAAGEAPDRSGDGRSSLLISVRVKGNPGNGKGGAKSKDWWLGPSGNPLDDELANAAGLELERGAEDFAEWMVESYIAIRNMRREFYARTFPDAAASRSKDAMVSIGDGKNYLGKIIPEDGDKGTRSVAFQYPGLGVLTVRQKYNAAKQRFENLDVTFADPETGEEVTEELPSSRFTLQSHFAGGDAEADTRVGPANVTGPNETTETGGHARLVPPNEHRPTFLPGRPSDPIPVPKLPPSEPGKGRELIPNHTGGNQTGLGPFTELAPGFPAQEQEPQIYINPDQSDEIRGQLIFLNEEGTPIYDGIPISERFIHKAGQKHHTEDVWFDEKGYPIFDPHAIATVKIELTGSRRRDKKLASKKTLANGLLVSIPEGYTWHHYQDAKTMQLVPTKLHKAVGHTGGAMNSELDYR